jgi:hypothetical protein
LLAHENTKPSEPTQTTEKVMTTQSTANPVEMEPVGIGPIQTKDKEVINPAIPYFVKSSGDGIVVKHESNMPKFDDNPTPFTPQESVDSFKYNQNTIIDNQAMSHNDKPLSKSDFLNTDNSMQRNAAIMN